MLGLLFDITCMSWIWMKWGKNNGFSFGISQNSIKINITQAKCCMASFSFWRHWVIEWSVISLFAFKWIICEFILYWCIIYTVAYFLWFQKLCSVPNFPIMFCMQNNRFANISAIFLTYCECMAEKTRNLTNSEENDYSLNFTS